MLISIRISAHTVLAGRYYAVALGARGRRSDFMRHSGCSDCATHWTPLDVRLRAEMTGACKFDGGRIVLWEDANRELTCDNCPMAKPTAKKSGPGIALGSLVKDRITGFKGIAIGRTEFGYGCVHIRVQAQK